MKNFPPALASVVEEARKAAPSTEAALTTLHSLDLTSLNATDTPAVIDTVLDKADQGKFGHVAAICVYPQFLTQSFNKVSSKGINLATVINFPNGKGEPAQTAADVTAAIKAGANEVDIVLDHESFLKGDLDTVFETIASARDASIEGGAKLKVILESSVFTNYDDLYSASIRAIQAGADFLTTSTGKHASGGASLEAVATMLQAIKDMESPAGVKVSGGVKTVGDGAQYIALVEGIMGKGWITPDTYRVGASGVLADITKTLGAAPAAPAANPSGY